MYKEFAIQFQQALDDAKVAIANGRAPNLVIAQAFYVSLSDTVLMPVAAEIVGNMTINVSEAALGSVFDEIMLCIDKMVEVLLEMFNAVRKFIRNDSDARTYIVAASRQFEFKMN